ncbi:proline-rich domain-containing protein [Actinomadura sp. SCN-SB]|uniref:proline-rich domain-containing protein n=1 Tax=Actinomadura sp. SCN-SB TaxID=3373092 RepID=UPI0037515108
MTDWFRSLAKSAIEPTLGFLAETQFATPEIGSAAMTKVERIWRSSLVIANTCFVLMVALAGVLLMAGETLGVTITPREIVTRLVAAFIAMNTSLVFIDYGIRLANGLSEAILLDGERINPDQAGRVLAEGVEASVNTAGAFFILVTLVAVVMAVILVFIYVMRLAITMVLIAVAPIALMFHALPQTDGIARLWWRGITGVLAIQVCQALVFITALRLLLNKETSGGNVFMGVPTSQAELVDLLLIIALLYVLICIPRWVARTVWQPAQPRTLGRLVRTLIIYKTLGAAGFLLKGSRGGSGRKAARAASGSGRRPGPEGAGGRNRPGGSGGPHNTGPGGGPRHGNGGGHGPGGRRGPHGANGRRTDERPGPGHRPGHGPHSGRQGGPAGGARRHPGAGPNGRSQPQQPRRSPGGMPRPVPRATSTAQPPVRPPRRTAQTPRPARSQLMRVEAPRRRRFQRRTR